MSQLGGNHQDDRGNSYLPLLLPVFLPPSWNRLAFDFLLDACDGLVWKLVSQWQPCVGQTCVVLHEHSKKRAPVTKGKISASPNYTERYITSDQVLILLSLLLQFPEHDHDV